MGSNAEVSIGKAACGIPREPGSVIETGSGLPQRARRAVGLW